MGQVQGYVDKNNFNLDNISGRLKTLGYEIKGQNFIKNGQIESVLNELVPLVEEQGVNVFEDLYLEEYIPSGEIVAKYQKGKVERKEN
ncbi:MAG: hypothetical protein GX923_00885 [Clostridia bacterium]|jgi:hypothetical protein|nr:hypothetical protein [Clostridia bacterium]